MSSLSRVFGWMPMKSEELVNIPSPPQPSLGIYTFQLNASQATEPGSRQSSPVASSPASSDSSLSLEGGFHSEPYSEPVRRGDPSWVARPRNPFIIFRCEYSKEHTKEGKRVRRPPGSQAEKTLSKRAAEAWHQLSAEEKNRFKELADQEKEEHARLHPHYRFRPVKRNASTTTKKKASYVPRSNSQPLVTLPIALAPRHPIQSAPAPIPLSTTPESDPFIHPTPNTFTHPTSPPPYPTDIAAIKAGRRRSASVPTLPLGQHPFISGPWVYQSSRLEMKRSRSAMAMANRPQPPPVAETFDPSLFEGTSAGYYPTEESESFGTVQSVFSNYFSPHTHPASSSSSSLSAWNGEPAVGVNSEGVSPWSMSSSAPSLQQTAAQQHSYTEFPTHADSPMADSPVSYIPTDAWAPISSPQYPLEVVHEAEVPSGGALFASTPSSYLAEYAMQHDYPQVLDPNGLENPEDAMFALDLNEYFRTY